MARALDENAAHGERRGGEEVAAPFPALVLSIAGDSKIRFVHEGGRLQRLIRLSLAPQAGSREFPQFVIDFRQHLVRGAGAAVRVGVRRHREREL